MSFGLDLGVTNLSQMAEAGYEFELELPGTRQKLGAFITVRGSQSAVVKNFAKKKFTEQQGKELIERKRGRQLDPPTIEELEQMAVDSACVRVKSWRGITEGGNEVECTPENMKRVMREHSWIRELVIEESDNLGNFTNL